MNKVKISITAPVGCAPVSINVEMEDERQYVDHLAKEAKRHASELFNEITAKLSVPA